MTALASPALRLASFAALAAFAAGQWANLVEGPPGGRMALAVAVVTAGGAVMLVIGGARLPPLASWPIAVITALVATGFAMAAVGVSTSLLWPTGWEELWASLDRGLAGLGGHIDYPYHGANEWSRLAILLAAPAALGVAATLAFWPVTGTRSARRLRMAALCVLLGLYLAATATHPPDAPLARGLVLAGLIAAWLWLPTLRRRDALAAGALVALAAGLAVPVSGRLDASDSWLDYSEWTWSSGGGTTYSWDHAYGPLDWPRDGERMLAAKSDRPLYWKTSVLDHFDGYGWERPEDSGLFARGLPTSIDRVQLPSRADPDWVEQVRISISGLRSEFVVGAGSPVAIEGLEGARASSDGTTVTGGRALHDGDTYNLTAYVPDPSPRQMRAGPQPYPSSLARYITIGLPSQPAKNAGPSELRAARDVTVPLRGYGTPPVRVVRQLESSPYASTYRLARRLAAGQPTAYDAVKAIENHLRTAYTYGEDPPVHDYPLAAFLFEDRVGYCQHFSGAMALMLRMVGIPSRVVAGFAPGIRDLDQENIYRVEDFDAHSWVEVYFNGIGWVTFDPTPGAAPASTLEARLGVGAAGPAHGASAEFPNAEPQSEPVKARPGEAEKTGGQWAWAAPAALLAVLLAAVGSVGARAILHRRRPRAVAAALQLSELATALDRLGWRTGGGRTLLELERRLRIARKPAAADYVVALRARRYADPDRPPPTLGERRAMRRELSAARGPGRRLRGLLAIPPGGPRRPGRGARGLRFEPSTRPFRA